MNYPSIFLETGNGSYEIRPTAYLIEQDEICLATIVGTYQPYWSVHLLMIHDVNLIFDFGTGSVGIAQRSKSIQASNVNFRNI